MGYGLEKPTCFFFFFFCGHKPKVFSRVSNMLFVDLEEGHSNTDVVSLVARPSTAPSHKRPPVKCQAFGDVNEP